MGFLSFLAGLIGNIFNYSSTQETNKQNREIHKSDQDFQAAQTQAAWERDDTAHQREVADLEAAGLSPLANTTGSPVTAPLGSASPIAMQAPQIDINSIINSMLQNKKLDEESRHNKKIEEYRADEIEQEWKNLEQEAEKIQLDNERLQEEFRHNTALETLGVKNYNELVRHNQEEESKRQQEINIKEYNEKQAALIEEMNRVTQGRQIEPHWCDSLADLQEYEEQRLQARKELYAELGKYSKSASAESHSSNKSTGGNAGFNVFQGPGANGGLQISSGSSESMYSSEDFGKIQEEKIREFDEKYPPAMLDEDKAKRNLFHSSSKFKARKAS